MSFNRSLGFESNYGIGFKMNQITIMAAVVLLSTLATGCSSRGNMRTEQETVGMANPASLYCADKGGKSVVAKDSNGGEYAICHLPDGTQIEEWALFRRDHPQAGK